MPTTIGQQLKQARDERHLSIEKAAESTRIRSHFLEAMEADDFESMPSPVQTRAFLRIYAEFLGLSLDSLIAEQKKQTEPQAEALPPVLASAPPEPPAAQAAAEESKAKEGKGALLRLKGAAAKVKGHGRAKKIPEETPELTVSAAVEPQVEAPLVENPGESEKTPEMPASSLKKDGEAQKIFSEIGKVLKQRREALSLTLEEVEHNTHVRVHYLKALENGELERLPSSVQARGMLNNYAGFLDMDVEALLLQFAEGLQVRRKELQPTPTNPASGEAPKAKAPGKLQRFFSLDILAGGGMVMILLVFAIWGTSRVIRARNAITPNPTAPSISDILRNTQAAPGGSTATPTAEGEMGTLPIAPILTNAITLPASGPGAVHVVLIAVESAWVRVTVDQKVQLEGRIEPGTAYAYDGNTQIEVLTGNGSAVSILYNESNLGAMGSWGEVVDHIYTADSILNPTPTFTPTFTITPKPSITPRPSATPRPSFTPRNSPTP